MFGSKRRASCCVRVAVLCVASLGGDGDAIAASPLFFVLDHGTAYWVDLGCNHRDAIRRRVLSGPEPAVASAALPVWDGGSLKEAGLGYVPAQLGWRARWRIHDGRLWSVSAARSAVVGPLSYGVFQTPVGDLFAAHTPPADPMPAAWQPTYRGAADEPRLAPWQAERGWRFSCVARICSVLRAAQGKAKAPANIDIWPVAPGRCRVAAIFDDSSRAPDGMAIGRRPALCIFEYAFGSQPERALFTGPTGRMQWAGTWSLVCSGQVPFDEPFWVFVMAAGRFCVTASGGIYQLRDAGDAKQFAATRLSVAPDLAAIALEAESGRCHLFREREGAVLEVPLKWRPRTLTAPDGPSAFAEKAAEAVIESVRGAK